MDETTTTTTATERRFPCGQCGAKLEFAPGAQALACPYCGHENAVLSSESVVEEEDFESALAAGAADQQTEDLIDVACDACGSKVHGMKGTTALSCPYCGSNIVATGKSTRQIKPRSLLPFTVTRQDAEAKFKAWLGSLWFAPSDLKKYAINEGRLSGMYMPAWTYDSDATTRYSGQRGDAYYVNVAYTQNVNGKMVPGTRRERRIRWTAASGTVFNKFDDLLVLASKSLPADLVRSLEPWDVKSLVPYDDSYLSGFAAESYQIDLRGGFESAREMMKPEIRRTINADIGGDEQRISSMQTRHSAVTFKHVLLPVWISAYRYRARVYRFLINARTGEVQGERPWSTWKITLAVVAALAIAAAVILVIMIVRR